MNFIDQVKGLSKDALIYGLGNAIGQFVSIFTAPILTRIFVPADYGVMALLQATVGFLTMLAGFNLNSGVYYYYFYYDDRYKKQTIISTSLLFFLFFGFVFSVAAWTAAPMLEKALLLRQSGIEDSAGYDYVKYIRILSVGIFFSLMDTNFRSLLRMLRLPHKYMTLNILQVMSNLAFVLLLVVYWSFGIEGALWAGVIASGLTCCVGFAMLVRQYVLAFSFPFLRLFLTYSMPQFPSVILAWFLVQSNRFFLNFFAPMTQQGYYAIAFRVASIFLLFTTAYRLAWDPFALSIMKEQGAGLTYSRSYTLHTVVMAFLGGFIVLFAKPVLIILTPQTYHVAYSMVGILIWAFLIQGNNNILGIGISLSKKTKYTSYAQAIAFIINIGLNVLLIPYFYAWGAALAFAGGIVAQSFAYYYFAQNLYPIPYKYWRMQLYILVSFFVLVVEILLVHSLNFLFCVLVGSAFIPIMGIITWRLGLSKEERESALDTLSSVLSRFKVIKAEN